MMEQSMNGHEVQSKRTSKQIIFGQEYKAIDSLVLCGMVIVMMGIVLTIMGVILLAEDDAVSNIFTLYAINKSNIKLFIPSGYRFQLRFIPLHDTHHWAIYGNVWGHAMYW